MLSESGTDGVECHKKGVSRIKVGAIRSLNNVRSLQLEYVRVGAAGTPVHLYGNGNDMEGEEV